MTLYLSDTLIDGITTAINKGFVSSFLFQDKKLIDPKTHKRYALKECELKDYIRIEEMSDPASSSILFLIHCIDGTKGYISSAFGIYANQELLDFMIKLKNHKHELETV